MGVADAVATVAGHLLARLRDDLTPAQETVLRRVLAAEGERPCKNAAPADTGAAPDPTAVKEPTMSHDLIEEHTPRGRQMAAALALAHLLETGPAELVEWEVDDLGRLHGQVRRPGRDPEARKALDAFAQFLAAEVRRSQGRDRHEEWVHLAVVAEYRRVPVRVWTHVAIRPVSPYASFGGAR